MNIKNLLSQIDLLPEADVQRNINGLLYPIRRPMLLEAAKAEPNYDLLGTLKILEETITSSCPERIHTLDSTALFVFAANSDEKDENKKSNAMKRVMAMCADGRSPKPRSKAELDKMINLEIQRNEDRVAENFSKAIDACAVINDITEPVYDEAELPEWITEAVVAKIIDVAVSVYKDGARRLNKARFDFQKIGPNASREGALALLKHFGVDESQVVEQMDKTRIATEELFNRLMADEVLTIDNPPEDNAPKAKAKRYRVQKEKTQVE